jgi:5-methyltetrahydropteroyltriglutamate--homocysteine methyltransferase
MPGGNDRILTTHAGLIAGTDRGFDTFIRWSLVDPDVAWLKLSSLAEGAGIASGEL